MTSWNSWAAAYRNWYTFFGAIFLLIYMVWVIFPAISGPRLISRTESTAIVTSISKPRKISANLSRVDIELQQEDDSIIKTFLNKPPYPKKGDIMPIIIWAYEDSTFRYSVFYDKWSIEHQIN